MKKEEENINVNLFVPIVRPVVQVDHREIDTTLVTNQGEEQSVKKLFQDYVLGRLDPRQLAGGDYDPEGSDEVDPMNNFGLTYEQVSDITDRGRAAAKELEQKTVANASAAAEQEDRGKGAKSGETTSE